MLVLPKRRLKLCWKDPASVFIRRTANISGEDNKMKKNADWELKQNETDQPRERFVDDEVSKSWSQVKQEDIDCEWDCIVGKIEKKVLLFN